MGEGGGPWVPLTEGIFSSVVNIRGAFFLGAKLQ